MDKVIVSIFKGIIGGIGPDSGTGVMWERIMLLLKMTDKDADIVNIVLAYFLPIGMALTLAYFAMEHLDKSVFSPQEYTVNTYIKAFLKLAICMIVLINAGTIISGIYGIGNSFVDEAANHLSTNIFSDAKDAMDKATQTNPSMSAGAVVGGFFGMLSLLLMLIVARLFDMIASVIVLFTVATRKFELYIRGMQFPIGVADMCMEGTRSNGVWYIKKFVACTLSGGMMVLGLAIGYSISAAIISEVVSGSMDWNAVSDMITPIIAVKFATAGSMQLMKSVTNEAFGV